MYTSREERKLNMTFIITFILLSIINVIFSTVRSIVTIKGGKTWASLISGGYFAFYNLVLVYTVSDFPMWQKCLITFICNVVGVWIVKFLEEKMRKDALWKIEVTIPAINTETVDNALASIPHSYIQISDKHTLFNFYCSTQKESASVKEVVDRYGAKYFASESKIL
jgi:hypothetical protein